MGLVKQRRGRAAGRSDCSITSSATLTGELQIKDLGCYLLTHVTPKYGRLLLEHVDCIDYRLETRTTSRRDADSRGMLKSYASCE